MHHKPFGGRTPPGVTRWRSFNTAFPSPLTGSQKGGGRRGGKRKVKDAWYIYGIGEELVGEG